MHQARIRQQPRTRCAAVAAAAALALGAGVGAPALAGHGRPAVSEPIATNLLSPLGLAVGKHRAYVAQSFAGTLSRIGGHGTLTTVARTDVPGLAIFGVDVDRRGAVAYTASGFQDTPQLTGLVKRLNRDGSSTTVADIAAYEKARNPDARNRYGFTDLAPHCANQVPADAGGGFPQRGVVDSNPYALTSLPGGGWLVADAGANAILKVSRHGRVSTAAVLPPVPVRVTRAIATSLALPTCTIGHVYRLQPVPTDVELGRFGRVFVTSLPGGPESPVLGANGGVFAVDTRHGKVRRVAGGLLGAVDLAVGRHGTVYVAELFGNRISKLTRHGVRTVVNLPSPGAVESAGGRLFATTTGNLEQPVGSVVTIRP